MGARKAIRAEKMKAEKKQKAIAVLRDCPTSPRKMRLVADIIRGVEINKALGSPPLLEERGVDPSGEAPQVGHRQTGRPRTRENVWKIPNFV